MKTTISYIEHPTDIELKTLSDGLEQYTAPRIGPSDWQTITFLVHDDEGRIIGGVNANTEKGWLYIDALWVAEDARGFDLGSQLMNLAEKEAIKRGCKNVYLDTYSCQAPGFYKKLGYEVFGELDAFPGENKKIFLRKKL